jgi:hypothetical protein
MGTVSLGRVLGGGFLAALVFALLEVAVNVGLLGPRWLASLGGIGLFFPVSAILLWGLGGIVLCTVGIWLYAALRPCAGPGPRTALLAGTVLWCAAFLYPSIGLFATPGFPRGLLGIAVIWGLVELNVAMLAGAWFYREDESLQGSAL